MWGRWGCVGIKGLQGKQIGTDHNKAGLEEGQGRLTEKQCQKYTELGREDSVFLTDKSVRISYSHTDLSAIRSGVLQCAFMIGDGTLLLPNEGRGDMFCFKKEDFRRAARLDVWKT